MTAQPEQTITLTRDEYERRIRAATENGMRIERELQKAERRSESMLALGRRFGYFDGYTDRVLGNPHAYRSENAGGEDWLEG